MIGPCIMRLNKDGGIKDKSHKFLFVCKNYVSHYVKELFNVCSLSGVYPNVFEKLVKLPTIHKKFSLHNILNYRPVSVVSSLSNDFENRIYNIFKVSVKHQNFLPKVNSVSEKNRNTELAAPTLMD